MFILQRPFPIYELDMNSGNAIAAAAARANRRVHGDAIFLAEQSDETTLRYLQRREECCSFGADFFSAAGVAREFVSNFAVHSWEPTDGGKRSEKRRECYTKLLILLEFSPISGLPNSPQKG